jgi:hypothetical protein
MERVPCHGREGRCSDGAEDRERDIREVGRQREVVEGGGLFKLKGSPHEDSVGGLLSCWREGRFQMQA